MSDLIQFADIYTNKELFSNHYLKDRLPLEKFWKRVKKTELENFSKFLEDLYENKKDYLSDYKEAQLEEFWIKPILDNLGHIYSPQHTIKNLDDDGIKVPDYVFFLSEAEMNASIKEKNVNERSGAYALGDAKAWKVKLNKKKEKEQDDTFFDIKTPHYQICYYIQATSVKWGILTNGKYWRLYHYDTHFKPIYYEIDLEILLKHKNKDNLMYFLLFFRRDSFISSLTQQSILETIRVESKNLAIDIQDNLKEQAYFALKKLCQGFFDKNKSVFKKTDLNIIYQNSLIVLYRLLFIFYAESRKYLPIEDKTYYSYSIQKIRQEIKDSKNKLLPITDTYWSRLKVLFQVIEGADEELNKQIGVPRYNGGLFSNKKHKFLTNYSIGDLSLCEAIKILSQDKDGNFFDYASLEINHLGAIYEGLLEYKVRMENVPYVAIKEDNREIWIEKSKLKSNQDIIEEIEPNEVFLETDNGERKSSGSYYTPSEIVVYMVKKGLLKLFEKVEYESTVDGKIDNKKLFNNILNLKILDPAMGSGHFLLEIVEQIANRLMKIPIDHIEEEMKELDEVILSEGEELSYNLTNLDEDSIKNYKFQKMIVENNIYGIDINPMAVELAKVGLWLLIAPLNEPLSFLDHRFKTGNSLVGLKLNEILQFFEDASEEKEEDEKKVKTIDNKLYEIWSRFIDFEKKKSRIEEFSEYFSNKIENYYQLEVEKAKQFEQAQLESSNIKIISDLLLAKQFGFNTSLDLKKQLEEERIDDGVLEELEKVKEVFEKNQIFQPFHWELEFPMVFQGDNPGFDLVLGNPPYISFGLGRVGKLSKESEIYHRTNYDNSAQYKMSWYAIFMEKAISLVKDNGIFCYILPDSYMTGKYFSKIRTYLLNWKIYHFVHFEKNFWKDAEVGFPTIMFLEKIEYDDTHKIEYIKPKSLQDLKNDHQIYKVLESSFNKEENRRKRFRFIADEKARSIINKIEEGNNISTSQYLEFHHGIRSKTGVGRQRIISATKKGSTWKQGLIGSNEIRQFLTFGAKNFINVDSSLLFSGGWNPEHIEIPKILIRRTGDRIIASIDIRHYYHTNALIYSIIRDEKWNKWKLDYELEEITQDMHIYLLDIFTSILNSSIFQFYYENISMKKGRTLPQVEIDMVEELIIPNDIFPFELTGKTIEDILTVPEEDIEQEIKDLLDEDAFTLISKITQEIIEFRKEIYEKKRAFTIKKYLSFDREKKTFEALFRDEIRSGIKFDIDKEINTNNKLIIKSLKIREKEKEDSFGDLKKIIIFGIKIIMEDKIHDLDVYEFKEINEQKRIYLTLILPKLYQLKENKKKIIEIKRPTKTITLEKRIKDFKIPKIFDSDDFTPLWESYKEIMALQENLNTYKVLLDKIIGVKNFNLTLEEIQYIIKSIKPLIF